MSLHNNPNGRMPQAYLDEKLRALSETAAELSSLVYNERIPDQILYTLLDWSAILDSTDPLDAFQLDRLPKLLHAFTIAFYSSLTFSKVPMEGATNPETDFHITFADSGGSVLIEDVRNAACEIAIALHRKDAKAIVLAADALSTELLYAIAEAVGRAN